MVTLIANAETGLKVTRKEVSYDEALKLNPALSKQISELSNGVDSISKPIDDGQGLDLRLTCPYHVYKQLGFDIGVIAFTHYRFHG